MNFITLAVYWNMKKIAFRYLYLLLGLVFLFLGIALFVAPIIPLMFFLTSTFFFSKSSRKLKAFMLKNKLFGSTLRSIIVRQALPFEIKILSFITANLSLAIFFYLNDIYYGIILNYIIAAGIVNLTLLLLPSYFDGEKE